MYKSNENGIKNPLQTNEELRKEVEQLQAEIRLLNSEIRVLLLALRLKNRKGVNDES
jgi:cell division protein FtsB